MPVLVLDGGQTTTVHVLGYMGNSITTGTLGKGRTIAWKLNVTERMRASRGLPWSPNDVFAITVAYSFHLPSHGNRHLDIENFLKPTVDAVAAGRLAPRAAIF
jgi:hypothetical protein